MDVGIIGGQDGPTAILVGGDPVGLIFILLLTATATGTAIWLFRHRRKK